MSGLLDMSRIHRRLDGREAFYRALRKAEYYTNRYGTGSLLSRLYRFHYRNLCRKNTWQIPINVCGKGLAIVHFGTIIISGESSIGENLRIHPGTVIGAAFVKEDSGAPRLGNNVYIGPGAKLFGPIEIGDNTAIGANAVVNKSFAGGVSIAGIPASVVSDRGSERYIKPFAQQ